MTKKYYAVRAGFKPGIYESWEECKAQTAGYSSPLFKSFKTLKGAEDYMDGFDGEEVLDEKFLTFPQAGSDETGNGAFIGPICVTAAYVDEEIYEKIKHLRIKDTKNDNKMMINEIAKELEKIVPHETIVLDNKRYNEVYGSENNLHKILAKAHNEAYVKLNKRIQLPKPVVIDDFLDDDTGETKYLDHLADEDEVYEDIVLKTQAEGSRISVAIAAYLATYARHKEIKKMEENYKFKFEEDYKKIKDNIKEFLTIHPVSELENIVKMHWSYYDEIIEEVSKEGSDS